MKSIGERIAEAKRHLLSHRGEECEECHEARMTLRRHASPLGPEGADTSRVDHIRESRIALTRLLPHVYLSCSGAGVEPCSWCQVLVAFDHAERFDDKADEDE